MRHSQSNALTLLASGYPHVQSAMAAMVMEANEIIVKPFEAGRLAELLDEKISSRKPAVRPDMERVAAAASALAGQYCIRVGGRAVGLVAALLTVEVHRQI